MERSLSLVLSLPSVASNLSSIAASSAGFIPRHPSSPIALNALVTRPAPMPDLPLVIDSTGESSVNTPHIRSDFFAEVRYSPHIPPSARNAVLVNLVKLVTSKLSAADAGIISHISASAVTVCCSGTMRKTLLPLLMLCFMFLISSL